MGNLQRAYRTKIYRLAFRYMKNHEDAEEVTQDVLFRVFRKENRRVSRGGGAFVLDLSDHVQHRNVASQEREVQPTLRDSTC